MAPFDMSLVQRGARLRRSPYFEATQRYGCWGYTVYNHTFLPIGYDDLEREYWKLLNDVTVWDVSVERNTEIAGRDAYKLMSLLTPRVTLYDSGGKLIGVAESSDTQGDDLVLRLSSLKALTTYTVKVEGAEAGPALLALHRMERADEA